MKRVLIVDDDVATRAGLAELLEAAGFACTGAGTLPDALASLRASPPDVLITDIRLGAYNGLQLVIKRPAHIPAIVMTGFPDAVLGSEAARSGARYIEKPINPSELVRLVTALSEQTPVDIAHDRKRGRAAKSPRRHR